MPFTCENRRYCTNIAKGHPHGSGQPGGSVFPDPIFEDGYSLWLEHVIEPATGDEAYWLMWYDKNGKPTLRSSGVLNKADLRVLANKLIEIP